MIGIRAHVEDVVILQISKACRAIGIDPDEAGYVVGGFGQNMPMPMTNGSIGVGPGWTVLVSLRSLLLGHPPVAGTLPVPGVLPTDEEFRAVVDRLVKEVDSQRQREFRGEL